jgi:hypothetical protein
LSGFPNELVKVLIGGAGGRFVVTEGFMSFVCRFLLDVDGLTCKTESKVEGQALKAGSHEGKAIGPEGKIDNMIGAFRDLEEASINVEQIVPELRVMRHEAHKSIKGRFVIG